MTDEKPSGGKVNFGCSLVDKLYTPYIEITLGGKVITLTADMGVESIEDGRRLCEILFDILSTKEKLALTHYGDQGLSPEELI